ncbi:MAG: hypothetical protein A2W36_04530 [Chloroflexi bacterium RBG_16_58_14]|nr:MAG: hypothetical protein A2W36_04530 [Chloroflexi bacterium RBG_16_58_14]
MIVPHFGDQPFWARRVHALGASPPPIPRRRLTAERLAQALLDATRDSQMQAQAQQLSERIRAENGVERAIEILTGKP